LALDGALGSAEDEDFGATDAIGYGNAPENFFTFVQRFGHFRTIKPKVFVKKSLLTMDGDKPMAGVGGEFLFFWPELAGFSQN
jgi:hypothetical protein